MRITSVGEKRVEYSDAIGGFKNTVIDVHKSIKQKDIDIVQNNLLVKANYGTEKASDVQGAKLDITQWLPFAAKKMNISPDIKDYVFVPVFTIPSSLPNRNSVAFPLEALKDYSVDYGMLGYQTFKGKPVHLEHNNSDPTKAYGIIVDCSLRPLRGYGNGKVWKLMELLAIDRTKNPDMANKILKGEYNSYSMGAMVGRYSCSICNANITSKETCPHVGKPGTIDFREFDGKLAFKNVWDIGGIETSIVATPAFHVANSDALLCFAN